MWQSVFIHHKNLYQIQIFRITPREELEMKQLDANDIFLLPQNVSSEWGGGARLLLNPQLLWVQTTWLENLSLGTRSWSNFETWSAIRTLYHTIICMPTRGSCHFASRFIRFSFFFLIHEEIHVFAPFSSLGAGLTQNLFIGHHLILLPSIHN